jgi:nucleoid DNA-binding protein
MNTDIKNKRSLHAVVAEKAELSKKEVATVLDALGEVVVDTLNSGGEIVLPGNVKVFTQVRASIPERQSKHPRTGEPMKIAETPARKVVKSKALQSLKNKVETDI